MKKIAVLLAIVLFVAINISVAKAEKLHEISGIVSGVQIVPRESILGAPNLTVVTFSDGRVVTFQGIILGMVFEVGKKHTISHNDDWIIRSVKKE